MYDDSVTKIENALAYAALGWAVFPCHTREADGNCSCGNRPCFDTAKHPLTENGVKSAAKDAGTLAKFFTGDYAVANIAVATGEPSGVWVIDVDDLAALAKLEYQYGRLPKTAIAETGRCGRHYFFRWTEALANLKNSVKFAGELDVRTTGGYILLPPSVHATGKAYRWLVSPDETPIVDAPDWLIDIVPKRETLTVNAVCVEERIAKYLAACPAAISGQSGHATTFGVICRVVETFPEVRGKDDEELLSLLKTWNERCVPPWTDRELLHKIGDAQRKAVTATPTPISPASIITSTSSVPVDNVDPPEEWPTLDADARHGIAGELLGTLEPHTEADSAGLLLTFLVAFGSIVGRNAYVYAGGDCHHANLYATLVGASSRARKGTSLGYILSVFAGLDTEWSGRRVNGLSSGEGVVAAVQDGYDDDGTLLTDDKRLLVIETEFGTTLRVLKREQNTLSGALRNAWDRGELGVLTRTAPLRASNAHISILGHITRNELIRYLSDVDVFNGFANRFLWVLVQRSKMLPEASPPTLDDLRRRLTMVCQTAKKIAEVKRSASASVIWCKSYPALVAEKRGLWDAVTSRAEAQVLRLSLIYALLDGSDTIDVPHLRAALAIWRYCDESARLIFTPDGGDGEGGTLEARIRQIVRERPGIMRTELRDTISHKIKAAELEGALTWLAGRGEIERRTSTENGRVCERVHPTDVKKQIVSAAMTVKSVLPPPTPSVWCRPGSFTPTPTPNRTCKFPGIRLSR